MRARERSLSYCVVCECARPVHFATVPPTKVRRVLHSCGAFNGTLYFSVRTAATNRGHRGGGQPLGHFIRFSPFLFVWTVHWSITFLLRCFCLLPLLPRKVFLFFRRPFPFPRQRCLRSSFFVSLALTSLLLCEMSHLAKLAKWRHAMGDPNSRLCVLG